MRKKREVTLAEQKRYSTLTLDKESQKKHRIKSGAFDCSLKDVSHLLMYA